VNRPRTLAALLAAGGVAAAAIALALMSGGETQSATTDGPSPVVTQGRIFDVARGDPLNVDLTGSGPRRCLAVSGEPYLSSRFCFALSSARTTGTFTALAPVDDPGPTLVVGFLPRSTDRAVVKAGESSAIGESRGSVFLAVLGQRELEAGEAIQVEFG
jgi:hypothetical protein